MTTAEFEDILEQNAQTGLPPIVNTSVDRKSHLRRRLDWKRQERIKVGQQGDRITFAHPSNRWKPDNAGRWGHVYAMALVNGQWRVWDVLPLTGERPVPGGLAEVSFPVSRVSQLDDGDWVGLFMAGTESTARSYVTPLKVRMTDIPPIDQPDPDPDPDPTDPHPTPKGLPDPEEVKAYHPVTVTVMSRPVVQDIPFDVGMTDDAIRLRYPRLSEDLWPHWNVGPEGSGTLGSAHLIYWDFERGEWVTEGLDQIRSPERRSDCFMPLEHITMSGPHNGDPVGIFFTGPARYHPDLDRYAYRSAIRWYTWPGLELMGVEDFEQEPTPPEPEPEPDPPTPKPPEPEPDPPTPEPPPKPEPPPVPEPDPTPEPPSWSDLLREMLRRLFG